MPLQGAPRRKAGSAGRAGGPGLFLSERHCLSARWSPPAPGIAKSNQLAVRCALPAEEQLQMEIGIVCPQVPQA